MWHNKDINEITQKASTGLTNKEANEQLHKYGLNKLVSKKPPSLFTRFLSQFSDFMVIILLVAAIISLILGLTNDKSDLSDCIIILIIVFVNSLIGAIEEQKAQNALEALKSLTSPKATVKREGKICTIPAEQIAVGDICYIKSGDMICADMRLIEANNLYVNESALTGESNTIEKSIHKLSENTPLAEQKNMVFSSCAVTSGNGVGVVVATGMNTQVGKIASMLSEESPKTPLAIRLEKTGKILGIGAIIICILIFIIGIVWKIEPFEMFMTAISLAVAAIPEGLVAIVTVILSLGVKKMADKGAIIRRLSAVETLGSASVICSDKTGTLTENKMSVYAVYDGNKEIKPYDTEAINILTLASLCSNSKMINNKVNGEPTENALVVAANAVSKSKLELDEMYPRICELAFDSKRKAMSVCIKLPNDRYRIITKGAFDYLMPKCSHYYNKNMIADMTQDKLDKFKRMNSEYASLGYRVLLLAFKDIDIRPVSLNEKDESKLCFAGLCILRDPLRKGVAESVALCKKAHIKTVMITGDHIETAKAVAKECGIYTQGSLAATGNDLDNMTQAELCENIEKYTVFARVRPEHKLNIIKAFQSRGHIVCMTGDGVNDAPALKMADIGCAMGKIGTEVAKNSSDMILTDDNFTTIVSAVKEGRGIYKNIKKAVHFLLSSNIGEVICIFFALLFGHETPLLAIQLLWINLVTDSLPAIAIAFEKTGDDIMETKPVSKNQSLFADGLWTKMSLQGIMIGALALLAYSCGAVLFKNIVLGRTMAFCVLSISQLLHVFNVRTEHSIFSKRNTSNPVLNLAVFICILLQLVVVCIPALQGLFKVSAMNFMQWGIVVLLSIVPIIVVELEKMIKIKK